MRACATLKRDWASVNCTEVGAQRIVDSIKNDDDDDEDDGGHERVRMAFHYALLPVVLESERERNINAHAQ